jgi:hypothetical protein
MRITAAQRHTNETRIRTAMDRLLAGHLPADGNCDITTLARLTDIDRAAFYGSRPYARLREEFEQRLSDLRAAGQTPDPHHAQVAALKDTITKLTDRLARQDRTIAELDEFKTLSLSRLSAQHEEITRLRAAVTANAKLRVLPAPPTQTGSQTP